MISKIIKRFIKKRYKINYLKLLLIERIYKNMLESNDRIAIKTETSLEQMDIESLFDLLEFTVQQKTLSEVFKSQKGIRFS